MELMFPTPWARSGDMEVVPQSANANGLVSFETGFGVDYEKDLLKDPNAKNIERKKLNYILNQICTQINILGQRDGLPVGMPIPWVSNVLPEGDFLYYDGQAFDRASNPKLAAIFPTGVLLDLRGVVIRGLDTSGTRDPGRVLGSYQEDAMQRIVGRIVIDGNAYVAEGPFYFSGDAGKQGASNRGTSKYCTFDTARSVRTANETRMKNVALRYITKRG